ncbi:MAG: RNA-protein complex protein Nop10 [Candidatus Altiarchaeota archaeon]
MRLLKCSKCGQYTLNKVCSCGEKTRPPKPPRYSPQDRYGKYRRLLKHQMEKR